MKTRASEDILQDDSSLVKSEKVCIDVQDFEEFEQIEVEICKLQSSLEQHFARRDELQKKLGRGSSKYRPSPLLELPTEVWQTIFIECAQAFPTFAPSEVPTLLTRVCRSWRNIAVQTPRLWNSFHVAFPFKTKLFPSPTTFATVAGLIQSTTEQWLERSDPLPLNISIFEGRPLWGKPDTEALCRLTSMLRGHSRRWRRLEWYMSLPPVITAFDNLQSEHIPQLEWLTIKDTGYGYGNGYNNRQSWEWWKMDDCCLASAPVLQTVRIKDTRVSSCMPVELALPWSQLRQLWLSTNNMLYGSCAILALLAQCYELRNCTLIIKNESALPISLSNASVPLPVHLRTLERFDIYASTSVLKEVLNNIVAPQLSDLEFKCSDWLEDSVITSLLHLLSSSSCRLQKLSYDTRYISEPGVLLSCLRLTPSLEELYFNGSPDTLEGGIMEHLTISDGLREDILCPRLRHISFIYDDTLPESTIFTFLRSRLRPPSGVEQLRSATIVSHSHESTLSVIPDFGEGIRFLSAGKHGQGNYDDIWEGRPDS